MGLPVLGIQVPFNIHLTFIFHLQTHVVDGENIHYSACSCHPVVSAEPERLRVTCDVHKWKLQSFL
jgi:hypothetical protein